MAMPVREQALWWGAALAAFLLLLGVLGNVLAPFIVAGAIAYLLDPLAARLERLGIGRTLATALIMLAVVLVAVLGMLLLVPLVIEQATGLARTLPQVTQQLTAFLSERVPTLAEPESTLRRSLADLGETLRARSGDLVAALLNSVRGVVNAVVFMVIVPVAAFYLLMDWRTMIEAIDDALPREHAPVIRRLAGEIDAVLGGFVRGQLSVCVILGSFYAVLLMIVGLQYGLIIGAIAGLISFIPYVGTIVGGVLAIGLALFQFWGEWALIAMVVAIFVSGQFLEGNFLTPKLVGRSVRLHPVWLLLALSAFGALFGFAGLMIAVPVAAMLGVLFRFGMEQYRASRLYAGPVQPPGPGDD